MIQSRLWSHAGSTLFRFGSKIPISVGHCLSLKYLLRLWVWEGRKMSKIVYEGWMVRYGRRKIGRSYIHMRYFVLEPRLLAYYKKKPQDNQVYIIFWSQLRVDLCGCWFAEIENMMVVEELQRLDLILKINYCWSFSNGWSFYLLT